jgi:mercuric ion binding protein
MNKYLILLMVPLLLMLSLNVMAAEQKVVLEIEGMTCNLCTLAVKKSLSGIVGVKDAEISYKEKKAWLTVDESVTDETLAEAVQKAGPYSGKVVDRKHQN